MKLFDKLKNALFEEEYIEVEEKPKKFKEKKQKIKPEKRDKDEPSFDDESFEEEKPIAKRIVPQVKKSVDSDINSEDDSDSLRDNDLVRNDVESRITMVTDEDLKVDEDTYKIPSISEFQETPRRRSEMNYYEEENEILPVIEKEEIVPVTETFEPKLYQASKTESYLENYTPHEYGNYEKKKEKAKEGFKPSPIISPIYGIVEDTRFMEKPRREVRITTSVSHEKMNIDDIRRKAFGTLSDEISNNVGLDTRMEEVTEEVDDKSNLLDLTDDSTTPEVENVTVGDAQEYFEDLGLEYNEDYIDGSKMTRTMKNAGLEEDISDEVVEKDVEKVEEVTEEDSSNNQEPSFLTPIEKDAIVMEKNEDNTTTEADSDNLFDLIDSMYE